MTRCDGLPAETSASSNVGPASAGSRRARVRMVGPEPSEPLPTWHSAIAGGSPRGRLAVADRPNAPIPRTGPGSAPIHGIAPIPPGEVDLQARETGPPPSPVRWRRVVPSSFGDHRMSLRAGCRGPIRPITERIPPGPIGPGHQRRDQPIALPFIKPMFPALAIFENGPEIAVNKRSGGLKPLRCIRLLFGRWWGWGPPQF